MNVQRARHNDAVEIFHIQNVAIIPKRLKIRNHLLCLVEAAGVDVRGCYYFDAVNFEDLLQELLSARASADDSDADAVVGAERARRDLRSGSGEQCSTLDYGFFDEITPGVF
jgi:hypothetical protein